LTFMRRPLTKELDGVDIAVAGIPFDVGTVNRPGARLGPRAIREQSVFVGMYPWGIWPWEFSIFERCNVTDYGDIAFSPGYTDRMLAAVEQEAEHILRSTVSLLGLGGDHLVSLPLLRAAAKVHGPLSLIHFDAHSDTWTSRDELNHGTMFLVAVKEGLVEPQRSVQVGIRSPNPQTHGFNILDAEWVLSNGHDKTAGEIRRIVGTHKAYLTFDIDFLDAAYCPGTGTPVVGGPTTRDARSILKRLAGLRVVGADQVEVSPPYDNPGQTTALAGATIAGDLLYLLALARGKE